jgi:dihydroxyacetone kinase
LKKFINPVEDVLAESLRGFARAHENIVALHGMRPRTRRGCAEAAEHFAPKRRSYKG